MNRRSFQKLAEARLMDSKALLKAKRYDAAFYMAGYAIECALKACIAKKTRLYDFPPKNAREVYTHELEDLLKSAEIGKAFQQDRAMDSKLAQYWEIVKEWKPEAGRWPLRSPRPGPCEVSGGVIASDRRWASRSPAVFIQILVDEQISAGRAIVDALRHDRVSISAAFWCRVPESRYWRLVIGSRLIDRIGPLEGYRRLHEILHRLKLWDEFSGSISLLSPNDPAFHRMREYAESPGQFGVSANLNAPYNTFQDAYFYSLAKS